jgi:outer membrane protein TolC
MEGLIQFLERAIAQASDTRPLIQIVAPHLRGRICVAQAKLQTTLLAYEDLRGKLAAGVLEAREAILAGQEQIRLSEQQMAQAERAYELSNQRSRELVEGSSFSEVLFSLTSLSLAQGSHINALRSYNRAQLRLWVLLGAEGASSRPGLGPQQRVDSDCPVAHGRPQ